MNTWNITASNAGTLNTTADILTFSGFENLTGGTNNDAFVFTNTFGVTGNIDGGAGGVNNLNMSAYTTGINVTLTGTSVNGLNGTTSGTPNPIGGSFSNITDLSVGSGMDTLTGG